MILLKNNPDLKYLHILRIRKGIRKPPDNEKLASKKIRKGIRKRPKL